MRASVVLALYNGARFLDPLLDSLRRQTRPAEEVLLVDDASTDGTPGLAERYIREHALPHWSLRRFEENAGYVGNFSRGIAAARGDLVFLCDQDDVWDLGKIEACADVFDRHPDALALCSAVSLIDSRGQPAGAPLSSLSALLSRLSRETPPGGLRRLAGTRARPLPLLIDNLAPGCALAFRREVGQAYLASGPHGIPHDWELNMIAAARGGLFFLNRPLVRYRLHDRNTTGLFRPDAAGRDFQERRLFLHGRIERQFGALLRYDPYAQRHAEGIRQLLFCRGRLLSEPCLSNWLRLHGHPLLYARLFPARARLGDLAAALPRARPGGGRSN